MPPIPTNTPVIQMRRQKYGGNFGHEIKPIHPDVVAEILEYLFNTTAWRTQPDLLKRRVQQWRLQLFEDGPGIISGGATNYPPPSLFAHPMTAGLSVVEANTDDDNQHDGEGDETDPDLEWIERGVELRMAGTSWNKLEEMLGRNRSTVRRVIGRTMTERGLTAPAGV